MIGILTMTKRSNKVFIDSNMLMFAAEFQQADIFEWMDQLYDEIYIHQAVLDELILSNTKSKVEAYLSTGQWKLFDPKNMLPKLELAIYQERFMDVKNAFIEMRLKAVESGGRIKSTTDLGEIATITACMMIGAQIICSNDFDIRAIVEQEEYSISTDEDDWPIIQDSAEDFCVYCFKEEIAARKDIRKFFRYIIRESIHTRDQKLAQLDERLN